MTAPATAHTCPTCRGSFRHLVHALRLKSEVEYFNDSVAVGSRVRVYPGPGPREGVPKEDLIASPAEVSITGRKVVRVRELGRVALDQVEAVR